MLRWLSNVSGFVVSSSDKIILSYSQNKVLKVACNSLRKALHQKLNIYVPNLIWIKLRNKETSQLEFLGDQELSQEFTFKDMQLSDKATFLAPPSGYPRVLNCIVSLKKKWSLKNCRIKIKLGISNINHSYIGTVCWSFYFLSVWIFYLCHLVIRFIHSWLVMNCFEWVCCQNIEVKHLWWSNCFQASLFCE